MAWDWVISLHTSVVAAPLPIQLAIGVAVLALLRWRRPGQASGQPTVAGDPLGRPATSP